MLIYGRGIGARVIYGRNSFYDWDNPRSPFTFNITDWETPDTGGVTNATATVTGIALTSNIGNETVTGTGRAVVTETGITSSIGNETVTGTAKVVSTGSGVTSGIGSGTVSGTANMAASGSGITSEIGSETVTGTAIVGSTGKAVSMGIGTVTIADATIVVPAPATSTTSSAVIGGRHSHWYRESTDDTTWKPMDVERIPVHHVIVNVVAEDAVFSMVGRATVDVQVRATGVRKVVELRSKAGQCGVVIDYTEKMRRQEMEFLEFLLAA